MNTAEIGIFIFVILVLLQVIQNMNRIRSIEWKLTQKMDKPPEEHPMEKFQREREERVARLEKEDKEKNKS